MGITKEGFDNVIDGDGYLQSYDWNTKSRKKLFSGRSEASEKFKQRKKSPVARIELIDEDETAAASTSAVIPGVIARLMGLDSLPKSNNDHDSTPILRNRNLECFQDPQISSFMKLPSQDDFEPYFKFQTETLPPKSAKSNSKTHNKFQSPIKRTLYILPAADDDDGHLNEAVDELIEMRPQAGKKTTTPQMGSSSAALKLRDSKKKLQASKRQPKLSEESQRPNRLNSLTKSWNGAVDTLPVKIFPDHEGSLLGVQSNGKSVSLAVLAKENVRRRASLGLAHQKGSKSDEPLPSHLETRKNSIQEPTVEKDMRVLSQNNQKQNKILGRGNSPVKSKSKDGRAHCADSSSIRQCNLSNIVRNAKVDCKKLGSEVKVDKKKDLRSGSGSVWHRKQSMDRNHQSGKVLTSSSAMMDKKSSGNQGSTRTEADVISFTFTAPLARSRSDSGRPVEAVTPDSRRLFSSSDGIYPTKLSCSRHSIEGSDSLSTIWKHILHGLTNETSISQQYSEKVLRLPVDSKPPSPVSVLEHSNSTDSCESSASNSTGGGGQCQSTTYQAVSTVMLHASDGDTELSDTASSVCDGTMMKRQETTLITLEPKGWELEYVQEMLHNIEKTFRDYALGRNSKIISHHIFDQLEIKKVYFEYCGLIPGINTRLLFDNVNECLDLRCRFSIEGGFKSWAKVMQIIKRKDILAQDVYKEICDLSAMKDYMVDGLVDWDISHRYGRWLSFDTEVLELGIQIESRILDSLIYEVVNDIFGF